MPFLLENSDGEIVADGKGRQVFNSKSIVYRPDGGQSQNVKVDEADFFPGLTLREIATPVEGEGPRSLGDGPLAKVDGKWQRPKLKGPALPPPPEPVPGDENYDYVSLRRRDYPAIEDQLDAQFHDAKDGTTTWVDSIQAVKDKYPKPVE